MPIDQQRKEEADYLADKLSAVVAEARSGASSSDKIKIGLQVAQFLVVGVIGTGIAVYAEGIKEQNEKANLAFETALKQTESRTTQAKVVQDIMPFLFDSKDETKPKAAILIISRFIDDDFALKIAALVNNDGARSAADQIQAEPQVVKVTVPLAAPEKSGWVYLGRYDGDWKSQYFEFPNGKSPDELVKDKVVITLKDKILSANLRKEPMRQQEAGSNQSVIGTVKPSDRLQINRVEPRYGTTFMWAFVSILPH
jgi:hypothetical protein